MSGSLRSCYCCCCWPLSMRCTLVVTWRMWTLATRAMRCLLNTMLLLMTRVLCPTDMCVLLLLHLLLGCPLLLLLKVWLMLHRMLLLLWWHLLLLPGCLTWHCSAWLLRYIPGGRVLTWISSCVTIHYWRCCVSTGRIHSICIWHL